MYTVFIPTLLLVNTSIIDPNVHYGPQYIFKYESSTEVSRYNDSLSKFGNFHTYENFKATLICQHNVNGTNKNNLMSLICVIENPVQQEYSELDGRVIPPEPKFMQMGTNSRSKMFGFISGDYPTPVILQHNFDPNLFKIVNQVTHLFDVFWINNLNGQENKDYIIKNSRSNGECTYRVKVKSTKDPNLTDDNNTFVFLKSPKPGLSFFYKKNALNGTCEENPGIHLDDVIQRVIITPKQFLTSNERRISSSDSSKSKSLSSVKFSKFTLSFVRIEPAVKLLDFDKEVYTAYI